MHALNPESLDPGERDQISAVSPPIHESLNTSSTHHQVTSALAGSCLWLGMLLGELRLLSQPAFWALCYVAAFTLPAAYVRSRWVGVGALVRESPGSQMEVSWWGLR